jgi:purine/pyrimidine-nucleoside phosphorylase
MIDNPARAYRTQRHAAAFYRSRRALTGRSTAATHSFTTIQRNTAMTAAPQFDQVSVIKRANVYFDGKCVSHTVLFADGSRKTLGVILPGTLNFGTDAPELMEVQAGQCRIRLDGSTEWQTYQAGDSFSVPGKSRFDIDVIETLDYVCSYL